MPEKKAFIGQVSLTAFAIVIRFPFSTTAPIPEGREGYFHSRILTGDSHPETSPSA
jgi:hypothetical protein